MELYYKDLISEDSSLDKLVDDLMLVVQGASELAEAAGAKIPPETNQELRTRLERIRETCTQLKQHAGATARATDKLMRRHPYWSVGVAFGFGLLAASLVCYRRR